MKNITIALPEKTAAWVRVWAAKQGKSVSAALAGLLESLRTEGKVDRGWEAFMGSGPARLSAGRYPDRESLHAR